jgi:hypothetical protein
MEPLVMASIILSAVTLAFLVYKEFEHVPVAMPHVQRGCTVVVRPKQPPLKIYDSHF